jgi:hypothetical protein
MIHSLRMHAKRGALVGGERRAGVRVWAHLNRAINVAR